MLRMWQSVGVIILCVIGAAVLLLILRRVWPPHSRREHNDLVGWQFSVLGTLYAVIVGFMLYTVWTNFQAAEVNAEMEADSLVQIARLADGFPPAQEERVRQLARDYATAVINQEWPAMDQNRLSPAGIIIARQLWRTIMQQEPQNGFERAAVDHSLSQLDSLLDHRRIRQLQSQATTPGVLWAVLIIGGVLTVISSLLFGTDNFKLHLAQGLFLTLMISLVLVAIADINQPFQGWVHVSSDSFKFALERIQVLSSTPH